MLAEKNRVSEARGQGLHEHPRERMHEIREGEGQ